MKQKNNNQTQIIILSFQMWSGKHEIDLASHLLVQKLMDALRLDFRP